MATIEQYKNGEAAKSVRLAFEAMQALDQPLPESKLGETFLKSVEQLKPLKVTLEQSFQFIDEADRCAIGDRLCMCEFPDAPSSIAVFMDDLADAMVEVSKAEYVSKEEARTALSEHKGYPLVASKVSGKYHEICRTWPKYCFYWNMEKNDMKCLKELSAKDTK